LPAGDDFGCKSRLDDLDRDPVIDARPGVSSDVSVEPHDPGPGIFWISGEKKGCGLLFAGDGEDVSSLPAGVVKYGLVDPCDPSSYVGRTGFTHFQRVLLCHINPRTISISFYFNLSS
jgi:hypothetical protein